jgi:predicted transcriptional regulator
MGKFEQLREAAEALGDPELDALIAYARSLNSSAFYDNAPADARASIKRGLEQLEAGQTVTLEELSRRLDKVSPSTNR